MLDRVIAEFDAQLEQDRDRASWRIEEQRILEDLAFPVWTSCRNAIETECKKRPRHLTFEVQPNTDAIVRSGKVRRVLSVEYRLASKSIWFKCGKVSGHYSIRIDDDRQARIWEPTHGIFTSPEEVADELLALIFA